MALTCCKKEVRVLSSIEFYSTFSSNTKSISSLKLGATVALYSYEYTSGLNITEGLILNSDGSYRLNSPYPILLKSGYYHFYSLCYYNNSTPYLALDQNFEVVPQNGVDYIWASSENQMVSGETRVDLLHHHIAANLEIKILSPSFYSAFNINNIKITLPDPSFSRLNIRTGQIEPSNSLLPLSVINGSGNSRELFIIPTTEEITIEFSYNANSPYGMISNIICQATINEPIEGGYKYSITIEPPSRPGAEIEIQVERWELLEEFIEYSKIK